MPSNKSHRPVGYSQQALGLLAVTCFLLQQLLAPLHCFLHSHALQGASQVEHAAAHCLDMHGLAHVHDNHEGHDSLDGHDSHEAEHAPESNASLAEDQHAPHPVEDHLSRKVERMVLRSVYETPSLALSGESAPWRPILTEGYRLATPSVTLQAFARLHRPPQRGPPA